MPYCLALAIPCFTAFSTNACTDIGGTFTSSSSAGTSTEELQRGAETDLLNLQVARDDGQLLSQRNERLGSGIQRCAQQRGQSFHDVLGTYGIHRDQRADRIERIEQEMRMDARFQRLQSRLCEKLPGAILVDLLLSQLISVTARASRMDAWTSAAPPNMRAMGTQCAASRNIGPELVGGELLASP